MKIVRFASCAVVACGIASGAFAALSKEYADFPKGPLQHLLTKEEVAAWKSVQTDEQAKAFIELFWAKRDPMPNTSANEFRDAIELRMKTANVNFHGAKGVTGQMSDRGKVFILMGSPTKIRKTEPQSSNVQTFTGGMPANLGAMNADANRSVQGYSGKELWVYEQGKINYELGQPVVEFLFVDQYNANEWKLDRMPSTDAASVFDRIARSYIKQPNLTEVPVFSVIPGTAPVAAAPVAFQNPALAAAVDELRAGKAAATPSLHVAYGEFVTPKGENFVPVQLYASAASGLAAGSKGTFFGRIDKADGGEAVVIFEESATLVATTGGAYVDASLALPPGQYRGTFGFSADGKSAALVSAPISVSGLDKDAAGVSPLILSNHVFALSEAQSPTDPYAFGGLKVVPKADRTFRKSDELWYFFELRNPGIDATTSEPKLLVKLTLTGTTAQGAPVKMVAPPQETPARELKGVPGHWAVGQSLPLETFHPGEYTLAVKVTDQTTRQSYDLQAEFRIVE